MRLSFAYPAAALLSASGAVRAAVLPRGVSSRDLHIVNANISPDNFTRSAVVAEGVFPGPLITGYKGDNFQINVINNLTDPSMRRATSIHWHGLFQNGTNEMDGGAFVNQCPIVPDNSFLYDFSAPSQAGTFWYHSHLSTQYCDGLRGPLVIYDPNDPQQDLYDIDDESTVITLADWYHQISTAVFPGTNKATPNPDSTLINGLGRFPGGEASPLAVVNVTPTKRHRLRIISTSCFPAFTFSIDNHNLTVIEADGVAHDPVVTDSLQIFAGQRYSVILNADQPVDNYWIRVNSSSGPFGFDGGINSAILRYDGAADADPTSTQQDSLSLLNEADLHPLVNPGAPGGHYAGGADQYITLQIAHDIVSGNFTINNSTFIPPSVPVLLQILSGSVDPGTIMPNGSVYSLQRNQVIEVSIPGGINNHPFHLHGHTFDVIQVAGSTTVNYENPVRRDVVSIGGNGDNVTFRFVTDNPGPWFLHCHIDWHLDAGLAVVFAEDAQDVATANPVNSQWSDLCPLYNDNNPDTQLSR